MPLLTAGWFQTTWFPSSWWAQDYWVEYGLVAWTIDGFPITIKQGSYSPTRTPNAFEWDRWYGPGHQRLRKVCGSEQDFGFTGMENAETVAWDDSVAKHLYTHITFGVPVALVLSVENVDTTVWVQKVAVYYSAGMKTRYFDVDVKEVP